ncbi:MAG TPA: hypothetical protein VEL77_15215 [Rugosimonospora sp.]|nr:hypothetical protein [Rugosimonospora sp.]
MNIVVLILQILPYILQAVQAIEAALPGQPGSVKKTVLMSALEAAGHAGQAIPEAHVKAVSAAVDAVVGSLSAAGALSHAVK